MPVGIDASPITLICPGCKAALREGTEGYVCVGCGQVYPVLGGVLRMLPALTGAEEQTRAAFDFEHRRYQQARYLRITPDLIEAWLAEVRLPRDYFKGGTVLDVGCGTGRWTYALASLGAKVVAVDVSDAAVEITSEVIRGLGDVTVIQASVFHLPFQPGQFDFVVSWGVLHHTRCTESAFRRIAPLVRPGGRLHIMVYERRNPVKVLGTEVLRMVMRRLTPEARYRWCGRLVISNRRVFQLVRGLIACVPASDLSDTLDAEKAQFGLYDWYSPRYNHLHRVAEVCGWFHKAGFDDLRVTSPIKYRRWWEVLRFGQCGVSISVQGRRQARVRTVVPEAVQEGRLADALSAAV